MGGSSLPPAAPLGAKVGQTPQLGHGVEVEYSVEPLTPAASTSPQCSRSPGSHAGSLSAMAAACCTPVPLREVPTGSGESQGGTRAEDPI